MYELSFRSVFVVLVLATTNHRFQGSRNTPLLLSVRKLQFSFVLSWHMARADLHVHYFSSMRSPSDTRSSKT